MSHSEIDYLGVSRESADVLLSIGNNHKVIKLRNVNNVFAPGSNQIRLH